jgi:hypothetical protein
MSKFDITTLDAEFSAVLSYFNDHHSNMRDNLEFYQHGAFYSPKIGDQKQRNKIGVNLLKAFADKNVNYTSIFPTIKVPAPDVTPEGRQVGQQNEKILYAVHDDQNTRMKQKKWAFDGTVMAEAFAETTFDIKERRVKVKRLDPRYCFYKFANANDDKLLAFWYAFPMTVKQIKDEYGIEPGRSSISVAGFSPDGTFVPVDGEDRLWVVKRYDADTECMWIGDQFVVKPHKHLYGEIPVDRCVPFGDADETRFPDFFLDPLTPLQAEFNDTMRKKMNVLTRLSNIPVVVKGVAANQVDKVKEALLTGGFIGLKQGGEAAFLQLQETKLFDDHLDRIFQNMKDISGYSTVTFGEVAGANTSGDAVAMYFQPTTQTAQNQWIAWTHFYESINAKVLKFYESFGKKSEKFTLYGTLPHGTFEKVGEATKYVQPSYTLEFLGSQIAGYYRSQVIAPSVTPKDEVAYKRLIMEAAVQNFIPKIQAFEEWGVVDPQDWLDLLEQEGQNPALNPDGVSKVMAAANAGMGAENVGMDQVQGQTGL